MQRGKRKKERGWGGKKRKKVKRRKGKEKEKKKKDRRRRKERGERKPSSWGNTGNSAHIPTVKVTCAWKKKGKKTHALSNIHAVQCTQMNACTCRGLHLIGKCTLDRHN